MKNKLKKRTLLLIAVILLNIIFAAGIAFLFKTISSKKLVLMALQNKILETEEKKQGISALKNLLKNIGAQKQEIDNIFTEENKIVDFIESLEDIAKLAGAEISFRNADIPANSSANNSLPVFLFDIRGSFEAVFKFLKLAENLPYQTNIQNLGLLLEEKNWRANFKIQLLSFLQTSK